MEEVKDISVVDASIWENNIMEVKREDLWDIDAVNIDKKELVRNKLEEFTSNIKGDLTTHLNEEYVVRVHFSKEDYSATDAFKHYLKQIAELKY